MYCNLIVGNPAKSRTGYQSARYIARRYFLVVSQDRKDPSALNDREPGENSTSIGTQFIYHIIMNHYVMTFSYLYPEDGARLET
jgi:hypothetical protein